MEKMLIMNENKKGIHTCTYMCIHTYKYETGFIPIFKCSTCYVSGALLTLYCGVIFH